MSSELCACSNTELLSSLDTMVRDERRRVVEILRHLNEVERRRLHSRLGYRSLFDYCVSRLRYSESGAGRRVAAARALRKFPEIGGMLASGETSLMSVAMVAGILTPENAAEVLGGIRGKSKREVETIVSGYRPETVLRDRVRRVCVKVRAESAAILALPRGTSEALPHENRRAVDGSSSARPRAGDADAPVGTAESSLSPGDGTAESESRDGEVAAPSTAVEMIQRTLIRFAADDDFMRKVERVRALLSHRMPGASFEQVFDAALEAFLDAHCPERREARRKARREKRVQAQPEHPGRCREQPVHSEKRCAGPQERCRANSVEARTTAPARGDARGDSLPPVGVKNHPTGRSRHIAAAVRDRVFTRDGGQCSYVSPTGRRCRATRFLQVDHILPFARGGGTTISNLRLLCGEHNRMMAERNGLGRARPG